MTLPKKLSQHVINYGLMAALALMLSFLVFGEWGLLHYQRLAEERRLLEERSQDEDPTCITGTTVIWGRSRGNYQRLAKKGEIIFLFPVAEERQRGGNAKNGLVALARLTSSSAITKGNQSGRNSARMPASQAGRRPVRSRSPAPRNRLALTHTTEPRSSTALRPPLPLGEGCVRVLRASGQERHGRTGPPDWGALISAILKGSQRAEGGNCSGTRVPAVPQPSDVAGSGRGSRGEGAQGKQPAGYGTESTGRAIGEPSPARFGLPYSQRDELDLRRYCGSPPHLHRPPTPSPSGERVEVRVGSSASSPPVMNGTEWYRQGYWGALTRPSATLSQRERGWICDGTRVPTACSPPSGPLSQRERVGVRVLKASSPPGTARNRTGRAIGAPSPGLRPPSPKGRGVGFATVRGCPPHAPPPSDPLSLWERVGVRVLRASSPPGTARNRTGRAIGERGHPLPKYL